MQSKNSKTYSKIIQRHILNVISNMTPNIFNYIVMIHAYLLLLNLTLLEIKWVDSIILEWGV